jgi:hypothetical protein
MVLAAHYTTTGRLTTTTVETVRFQRPHLVTFRLLRGPVPHVLETFELANPNMGPSSCTRANSAPTCGNSGDGGATASQNPGNRQSPTRSRTSKPKPSDAPVRAHDRPHVLRPQTADRSSASSQRSP